MSAEPHRIDVHHHIVPREYVEALAEHGGIGASARIAIERDDAARLFPRRVAPAVPEE
jgi:hypothetical protein